VLRREYVRGKKSKPTLNALHEHILARAGTWDSHCSGEELLRKTRPVLVDTSEVVGGDESPVLLREVPAI
jgi:hypothetical protein